MEVIDLSYTITNNMPVFPNDKGVLIEQLKFLDKDYYNQFYVQLGMHSGTHIDIPMHLIKDYRTIDVLPIENFIGNGVLLDVRGESIIKYKLEYDKLILKDDIVLLLTDFADLYNEPKKYYEDYPVIDNELCDFFIDRKIKILGMDTPSPDKIPFTIHKKLLENNIFMLENLTNLKSLININFEIFAVPLKINIEASVVRAFAKIKG